MALLYFVRLNFSRSNKKKRLHYFTYACNQHKCNTIPLQREKGNARNILFSCFHSM